MLIRAVIKKPGDPPEVRLIEHTLETMQEIVGGYIEIVTLNTLSAGRNLALVCNEDGWLIGGLAPNVTLDIGVIVGTVIFLADSAETQGLVGLTEAEAQEIIDGLITEATK